MMMTPYRWNAKDETWEFYVPEWGGWNVLRIGPHVSSPPMGFVEGFRHIVTHPLVRGREGSTGWLRDMVRALPLSYLAAPDAGGAVTARPTGAT